MTELQATELHATPPLADELAPVPENAGAEATNHRRAVRVWQGVLVLILLAFVLLLAARLIQTNQSEQRASGIAPAFTLTTFDGETISSADLLGKGVVLNFWASWCDPCRDEAAMLEETWQREQGNDIVFIGLDYLDQEPAAKAYLKEFGITYPNGPDLQSAAARRYGIKGVPETFFINPQGSITDIVIGPIVSQGKMEEYLAKIRPQ
jgi:cytochrome c biogenesis protein CcmG/thiol:disulfide interchange protein DsbE